MPAKERKVRREIVAVKDDANEARHMQGLQRKSEADLRHADSCVQNLIAGSFMRSLLYAHI